MRKIAIVNHKGGVGKTTSTLNIGAGLTKLGKRVLLVDLDPQGSLSSSVGFENQDVTVYELMKEEAKAEDALRHAPGGYDIICSDLSLSGAESELSSVAGREKLLHEALEPIEKNYDYILVDCPPSLGILTMNAMDECDEIFIPMLPEFLPMKGINALTQMVAKIKKRINPRLKTTGIFFTMMKGNTILSRDVRAVINEHFGDIVFNSSIRHYTDLAAAPSHGMDIFQYDPNSKGAANYMALCLEIVEQEKHNG